MHKTTASIHLLKQHGAMALVLMTGLLFTANKASAQVATQLTVPDTRNADSLPSAYRRVARFDFKNRSVIGVPGTTTYNGLLTFAPWSDASGGPVYQMSFDPAGLYLRSGYSTGTWASWRKLVIESTAGVTALGNGAAGSGLNVNGTVKAREVTVTTTGWADDVFDKKYPLAGLPHLESQIHDLGHLPGIPSAEQVAKEGVPLGALQEQLVRKIEELTLYIIEQDKKTQVLQQRLHQLELQQKESAHKSKP